MLLKINKLNISFNILHDTFTAIFLPTRLNGFADRKCHITKTNGRVYISRIIYPSKLIYGLWKAS